jgi:hypothetical protein
MDGGTPSLPVTGEWTVGHHPYRLRGDGRWDAIPTGYRGMEGETPSLPVTGEWTVRHHPYRLQGNGRWDTIPSDCTTRLRDPSGPPTSRSGSSPLGPHVLHYSTLSDKSRGLFAASSLLQGVLLPKQVFSPSPKLFSLSRLLGASTRWALVIRS